MKTALALAALGAALAGGLALAYEKPLSCTVQSTGTTANSTSCSIPFGAPLAVQCDAAACVRAVLSTGTATVTCTAGQSNTGVKVSAGQLYDVPMQWNGGTNANDVDEIAVISVSGTVNCEVFMVVVP